jgi:hypothetical protein
MFQAQLLNGLPHPVVAAVRLSSFDAHPHRVSFRRCEQSVYAEPLVSWPISQDPDRVPLVRKRSEKPYPPRGHATPLETSIGWHDLTAMKGTIHATKSVHTALCGTTVAGGGGAGLAFLSPPV